MLVNTAPLGNFRASRDGNAKLAESDGLNEADLDGLNEAETGPDRLGNHSKLSAGPGFPTRPPRLASLHVGGSASSLRGVPLSFDEVTPSEEFARVGLPALAIEPVCIVD